MALKNLKVKIVKILFWAIFPVLFNKVMAQDQITFRQLSVNQGLSQNSAISIAQDSTGYLWIATQDGLNQYDGKKFKVFPYNFLDVTRPDYSNLGKIYVDRVGGLWIIPIDQKLYKFDEVEQSFDIIDTIEGASVVFQDSERDVWVGTFENGLYQIDSEGGIAKYIPIDADGSAIYNIYEDVSNSLLLCSDKKIVRFDKKSGEIESIQATSGYGSAIETNYSDIVRDKQKRQWIGTFGNGLFFKREGESIFSRISELAFTDPLPTDLNILDLHVDTKDRLWIATYGRGLYMADFASMMISHFNADKHNPKAIHYNDILSIYEDYSNTLWFGTDGAGLSYFDEYLEKFNSLTTFQTPSNINIDVVRAITVDSDNSIWIGTSGKGLTQYEPKTNSWRTFTKKDFSASGIPSDRIMSLLVDDEDDLWVGTQGEGLTIFDGEEFDTYTNDSKVRLSAKTVWSIFKDDNNKNWLGTRENGLIQFDKYRGEIKKYTTDPNQAKGLPSNNIRAIEQDEDGNLWLGTEADGIVWFDVANGKFKSFKSDTEKNSLSNDNIKSLYFDKNKVLWIGTNGGGLNVFDTKNEHFYNYTVDHGLPNNVIYGILPDDGGNLWLSSNKGITKFSPPDNFEAVPIIINYDNYDGLATEFNTGAYHKDLVGNLYFGGLEGFYWFDPENIEENTILPKTTITGFQVLNEERPLLDDIELTHDENTLSFTFSSLQYSLPEKNQYQYKLANYEEDWIHAGNNNFARYSHLPPGEYKFMVKSSNYDGVWNPDSVVYSFTIAQPWYWNIWAKLIYVLLLLTAIYSIYRYLKWRWRMKFELQQKENEAERFKKLNDFKSKLYTDISHEFRTPLTLISGPIDLKLGEGGLSDIDYTNFSMIKRNTNRLIGLVDQLLDLAKLQKGKLKLSFSEGNLGLFLATLAKAFEYRAKQKKVDFEVDIADFGLVSYDEDAIEKITTNLLSNAIKYCSENGRCSFKAIRQDENLLLKVSNSIESNSAIEIEKLFVRFYQKDEYAEGAGVGLSLVKELVQLYKGEVSVKMESKDQICFKVLLPMKKVDAYNINPIEGSSAIAQTSSVEDILVAEKIDSEEMSAKRSNGELPILLIVEDHIEVRQFIKASWMGRFHILEAENGKSGIEKALEVIPDLVITDVRMPVLDGIYLCNKLKTDERTSHIPIILLTAGVGEENELRGLTSGADDFVTKPFKLRVLQKRVENLIQSRQQLRRRYSQEIVLKAKDISVTPTDEVFLKKVQKVLDEHLSDSEFGSAAFSKIIGMSRMQLHRKLVALTDLSTSAFIRSQRLKQAVHILKTSDATVNEVAYAVGFNTPSYFIKCFKESYNKTPSEYMRSEN